jgi:outer membrane protein assembly factor BamB
MVVAVGSWAWAGESWTQWGGPNQDFKAASTGLASSWPDEGPKKIWERELGDGYSAILVEDGRLYTMYRDGEEEVAICLEAGSGETIWEQRYAHKPAQGHVSQFGEGPRSTPLISGNQIFTIGVAGRMHSLDKKTGKVQWSHELWGEEFGGNFLQHGYASSPIDYGNTVIALVGGEDKSIVAFKKKDGKIVWKSESFKNSYATPKIMKVAGSDQLVTFMAAELVGLDPKTGELKWSYSFGNQFGQNISPPVMSDGGILFLSSTQAGSRGLKISKDGEVEEVWSTRKIQFYHVSSVKIGDYVYGSTGSMAPAFMSAINIETGEIPWRARGFAKANVIYADGKLYILDEDGNFYMATATPEKLEVISKIELLDKVAWTVPTIVGKTMFVRDKTKIMAVDLG